MKNNLKMGVALVSALFIGMTFNSFAMSEMNYTPLRVAVVDVPSVVASSSEVNKLKDTQKTRITELTDFVKKAKADVDATKDSVQKKTLEDKYNEELRTRKAKIDKDYASDLAKIQNDISNVISKQAKSKNYQMVLSKGVVLYGGDDITADIKKIVK